MSAPKAPGVLPAEHAVDAGRDVVALYRGPNGPVYAGGAAGLRGLALEEFGPVIEPVPYRGRKSIITYWPVATGDRTVVCSSLRQWRLALELDFDPAWVAFSANPVELRWRESGRKRRWRPDFVARTSAGVREVLVLKPAGAQSLPATKLRVLHAVARAAGWRVRQVPEPSGVRARNLAWLAGYRFPADCEDGRVAALLEAFTGPAGVRAGVAASGLDALTGLDLAYRLLWQRRLYFDITQPLLPDAVVWTGPGGDGREQATLTSEDDPAGVESAPASSPSTAGAGCSSLALGGCGSVSPSSAPVQIEGPWDVKGGRMAGGPGRRLLVSIGARVRWQGREWEVVAWQGPQVTLTSHKDADGGEGWQAPQVVSYRWLVGAEDFAVLHTDAPDADAAAYGWGRPEDRDDREEVERWQVRMVEIDTGLAPGRSEPEQGFGPGTTLAQRCAAMSARLAADGIRCSAHTLADKRRKWKAAGENAAVLLPGPRTKRPGAFTDPRCLKAMQEVVARRARDSDVTIEVIREEVEDLLRSRHGAELDDPAAAAALLPSRSTFYLRMRESGLADILELPTRARVAVAAAPALPHGGREIILRPGQVTQVDTTPLRILVRGDDGRPIATEMTVLIDVASRSIIAAMITPSRARDAESGRAGRSTRAIDLTLMLAQAFAPWPVMPGWDPLSAAAVSSLPFGALAAADDRFTKATAARPVIHPEMIIYDQGSPYVSEHFTSVCDRLRIARRPARKKTPDDKPLAENFFITLAHRFSQHVKHGWQGRSHKKRGRGIDRMPLYMIAELQQMAQEWVALEYQQTPHAGLRDPFRPGTELSPNDMYAVQIPRSGYRPVPFSPAANRFFLLPRWATPGKDGFMIDYRRYQPIAQDAGHYREILLRGSSKLPGRGDKWECRFNPYRPERVWLYDHTDNTWVTCDFRLRHLLNDPWTADMWQEHAERHQAGGGSEKDEEAITLALAQRGRRRRSRRPPPKRTGAEPPFQGLELATDQPAQDPYAGLEEFDLSTLRPYPALPISPLAPPSAPIPLALPAGSTDDTDGPAGAPESHPLHALFPDDGADRPPDAAAAGASAALHEVVDAELLDDLDPPDGDQDDTDGWER